MTKLALLAILALVLSAQAAGAGLLDKLHDRAAPAHEQLSVNGVQREFLVQQPDGSGPFPVVVMLHGGTQTAEQIWQRTGMPELARQERFMLVAPQGLGKHWNDGRGATMAGDAASTADDSGFLHALIAEVVKRHAGDAAAVFMVGVSNGGFMTMRFACEHADDLRAAASVISNLPIDARATCHPGKPLPWLAMNGMRDPIVPFDGMPAGEKMHGQAQPGLLSADESFAFWADHAGCSPMLHITHLVGQRPDDTAEMRTRENCAGGQRSVQYAFAKAGHSWPGMRNGLIVRALGGSSTSVDGAAAVWGFFQSTLGK